MLRPVEEAVVQRVRSGQTGLLVEQNLDHRFALGILPQIPSNIVLTLRTGHLLALPVNLKVSNIKSARGMGLPTGVYVNWPDEVNLMHCLTV
jgi:hypothetical protein